METHTLPHFDETLSTVHISLFHNVRNAAELRSRLIAASQLPPNDPEQVALNLAFIDAKVIASRQQLLNACLQTIVCAQRGIQAAAAAAAAAGDASRPAASAASVGSLRTKTVHSEILWTLMPGHNISDSLRKIGISPTTTSLILVHVTSPASAPAEVLNRMTAAVQGDLDVRGLGSLESSTPGAATNWKEIGKLFKLSSDELPPVTDAQGQSDAASASKQARAQALINSMTAIKNVAG